MERSKDLINRNVLKIIFSLVFILFLTSCKDNNLLNKKKKEGYKIIVRYEANGGSYLDREGVTLIDAFNPDDFTKDANGNIHIKLTNPTDKKRPAGGSEGIYITRTDYFLVGWYKNKTIKTNENEKPINENGEALVLINDNYYLESDNSVLSTPDYDYSGYWDFENDTIEYNSKDGEYNLTLYAVWSKYFEFNYYYNDNGEWKYLSKNSFDYEVVNETGSNKEDKDTVYLPRYENGAMNYNHKYLDNSTYSFPKINGYTFKEAYTDMELTNKIDSSYEHNGSIDYSTGKAINRINNIYITLEKGEYYYINTAQELIDNPNVDGIYVIEKDLDFTGLTWPTIFSLQTFNGKMISKEGETHKLSNIKVVHSNDSAKLGGVFGSISKDAKISNLEFDNVTFDLAYCGKRNRNINIGLFAGKIEDENCILNVKLSGEMLIGEATPGEEYSINLIANGENNKNITVTSTIHLSIYGVNQIDVYSYLVDPENVTIDENNNVKLTLLAVSKKLPNDKYIIQ